MNTVLVVTIVVTVLVLALTFAVYARSRSVKALLAGLGVALVPLGLWFMKLTPLLINGVQSIIDFAKRTVWTDLMTWGAGLLGLALLLLVVSAALPRRERSAKPVERGRQTPAVEGRGRTVGATPTVPAKDAKTSEDDEVEAILRRRGIM